ncbi:MAG: hypothetical protein U1D69_15105 [Polynucleobacter sp.]|nr:hypothetical protein [Polynucleobacter sp.]
MKNIYAVICIALAMTAILGFAITWFIRNLAALFLVALVPLLVLVIVHHKDIVTMYALYTLGNGVEVESIAVFVLQYAILAASTFLGSATTLIFRKN